MDTFLTCKYDKCHKFYLAPVRLPCDASMCHEHVKELLVAAVESGGTKSGGKAITDFKCPFCSARHESTTLAANKDLVAALALNAHLSGAHVEAKESLKRLGSLVDELTEMSEQPGAYLARYVKNIRGNVDAERDRLVARVQQLAAELHTKLDAFEAECKQNLSSVTSPPPAPTPAQTPISTSPPPPQSLAAVPYSVELGGARVDVLRWQDQLRNPKLSVGKVGEIAGLCEASKRDVLRMLAEVRARLFRAKECTFIPFSFQLAMSHFGLFKYHQQQEEQTTSGESLASLLLAEASPKCVSTLSGHTDFVFCLAVMDDECERLASGSRDKTIKIWDLASATCLHTLAGHTDEVNCLLALANASRLISGSSDSTIRVWELSARHDEAASSSSSSLNAVLVAKRPFVLAGHTDSVSCVCLTASGELASGSDDTTIKIWSLSSLKCVRTLSGHASYVFCLKMCDDGVRMASGGRDRLIKIWNLNTYECVATLSGHTGYVVDLQLRPNGHLLSASFDGSIREWSLDTAKCTATWQDTAPVRCMRLVRADLLASGNAAMDDNIKLWDLERGVCVKAIKAHPFHSVTGLEVLLKGGNLVSCSADGTIKVWQI